jgi:hypothetical protein
MLTFAFAAFKGRWRCLHLMTKRQVLSYGTFFLAAYLALVPTLGPYWKHFREYGSPFMINIAPAVFPNVFERTYVYRPVMGIGVPGVTSIADALFTFRLLDMLRNPIIAKDSDRYPLHRTSLWSQLYGRAHFVHFDAWPPSWQLRHLRPQWATPLVWNLGRLIFLCALLPTMILVVALWRRIVAAISIIRGHDTPVRLGDWLLDLAVFGYMAFIIAYSLRYRDSSFMKAIFVFPGLLGFLSLFACECDRFYRWCNDKKLAVMATESIFACLCLLYTGDVIVLIAQLGINLFF